MRQSVTHLNHFYASPLGRMAKDMAARRLQSLWSDMSGQTLLGYGYAMPYLEPYIPQARRIVMAMPGGQGAEQKQDENHTKTGSEDQPRPKTILTCLVQEDYLPFSDASFDRIFVAHGIEETPNISVLLSELWRVTQPEGRIVIMAANRSGLWAGSEKSPFGAGQPFSRTQLRRVLQQAGFIPVMWSGALYAPPVQKLSGEKFVYGSERFGETVWPNFSGLILVEALKRLYVKPKGLRSERPRPAPFKAITIKRGSIKRGSIKRRSIKRGSAPLQSSETIITAAPIQIWNE